MPKQLSLTSLRDELAYVNEQLTSRSLPFTLRHMWESRREEISSEIEHRDASFENSASVALVFEGGPVRGTHAIEVDFSAQALETFQDLISNIYAEHVISLDVAQRGPVRGKSRSKLFLEDVVHGSMGFILKEEQSGQSDAFPTALSEAVEEALSLIDRASSETDDGFNYIVEHTSPRTILALKALTDVIHGGEAMTKISTNESIHTLGSLEISRMHVRLHDAVRDFESEFIEGILNGIFPDDEGYEFFNSENSQVIHGKASRSIVEKYLTDGNFRHHFIATPVAAQFKRTTIKRPGHDDKVTYFLEAVGNPRRVIQTLPET